MPSMESLFYRLLARHEGHHDDDDDDDDEVNSPTTETPHAHPQDPDRQWSLRNHKLAHIFTAVILLVFVVRLATMLFHSWQRRRRIAASPARETASTSIWSKTTNALRAFFAYITLVASTVIRLPAKIRSPIELPTVPIGQVVFIVLYCVFMAGLLSYRVVKHDATYAERIGFRGALISVPQVPIVYLLATRAQIPGLRYVLGGSYKDLIWFHRWISRVFFASVTVHAVAFFVQWAPSDFLWTELEIVPYVKWGIYAWAVMIWTVMSSLLPIRTLSYEFFVMQHTVSAFVTLGLMWLHVPGHHRRSVDMAIGIIALDWVSRIVTALYMNFCWKTTWGECNNYNLGHKMTLEAVGKDMTVATIHNVNMAFAPGESIDIWMPKLAVQSPHTFTILPPMKDVRACQCPRIQLALKTKSGFTAKLNALAMSSKTFGTDFRVFILNKEGRSPPLAQHDSLVLISSSTGASFSAAVVEKALSDPTSRVRKIKLLMIGREKAILHYYRTRIKAAAEASVLQGVTVGIDIAVTGRTYQSLDANANGSTDSLGSLLAKDDQEEEMEQEIKPKTMMRNPPQSLLLKPMPSPSYGPDTPLTPYTPYTDTSTLFSPNEATFVDDNNDVERKGSIESSRSSLDADGLDMPMPNGDCDITESFGRPDVAAYLNSELYGPFSTAVSVCGGPELTLDVRTSVARINASRATQGYESCHLHVEGFSTGS